VVPVSAVLAIYARETGQGMALPEEVGPGQPPPDDEPTPPDDTPGDDAAPKRGAHLRVIK
jgi:stringent starvation protein B